jgi:hypothetical protein
MRKTILLLAMLLLVIYNNSKASSQIDIGFYFGLATPNGSINDVYNSSKLQWNKDSLSSFLRDGTKIGYTIGIQGRLILIPNLDFVGGLGMTKFPQTKINVTVPNNPTNQDYLTLTTSQTIVSLSAGLNYYFLKSFIDIYGTGDLSYNYLYNSVDYTKENIPFPLTLSPTDNRLGCGLGAGFDLNLKIIKLNIEGKYHFMNLIGITADEKSKNFFTLTLGIYM